MFEVHFDGCKRNQMLVIRDLNVFCKQSSWTSFGKNLAGFSG